MSTRSAPASHHPDTQRTGGRVGLWLLNYGLLGWAMGAVAVPIYIQVPYFYSRVHEVPVGWVGTILLVSRLIDAFMDPLIGLWLDRRQGRSSRYILPILLSVPLLLLGMYGVFFPFGSTPADMAVNLLIALFLVHLGFSLASIAYQSWGAELGNNDKQKSMFVAAREGIGIFGVVFAVSLALETWASLIYSVFTAMLLTGVFLLLRFAPTPAVFARPGAQPIRPLGESIQKQSNAFKKAIADVSIPLRHSNFRRLMAVFLFNGLAAALPATLVPFYMRDRLGLADSDQWVLAAYFLVGAGSTVFWVWLGSKVGLARAWLIAMLFSIPAFVLVILLQKGDLYGYLVVCIITGFALGADLSMPAALVAHLIADNGEKGRSEGSYFGLWNWINTCNLALAPSLALNILDAFNYDPEYSGSVTFLSLPLAQQINQDPMIWMYALLPCLLRSISIALLFFSGLLSSTAQRGLREAPA